MCWPRLFLVSAAVCISGSLYSADYRLTVNGTPKDVEGAKAILIYESGMKQGDRVLEVRFSTDSAVRGYEVSTSNSGSPGVVVAGAGAAKGFGGDVVSVTGKAPAKHLGATLALLNGPLTDKQQGFFAGLIQFAGSTAGLTLFGFLTLAIAAGYFVKRRISGKDEIYVPARRRKTIETALSEITERLEEIDANQKNLVKKPPMLRTFKAQVDGFEERLDRLHATISKASSTVVGVESGIAALRARVEQTDNAVGKLTAAEENTTAELHALAAKVELAERTAHESAARSAELLMVHSKQDDELQGLLFVLQDNQKSTLQTVGAIQKQCETMRERVASLETGSDAHGRTLGETKGSLDALSQRLKDFDSKVDKLPSAIDDKLSELSNESGRLADDLRALAEALDKAATANAKTLDALGQEKLAEAEKLIDLGDKVVKLEEATKTALEAQEKTLLMSVRDAMKTSHAGPDEIAKQFDSLSEVQGKMAAELSTLGAAIAGLRSDAAAAFNEGSSVTTEALESQIAELARAISASDSENARRSAILDQKLEDLAGRLDQRAETVMAIESQLKDQKSSKVEVIDFTPMLGDMRHHVQTLALDHAKTAQSLAELTASIAELVKDSDIKTEKIEAKFNQVVATVANSRDGAWDPSAIEAKVAGLADSVSSLRSDNERHASALEARVANIADELHARADELVTNLGDAPVSVPTGQQAEQSNIKEEQEVAAPGEVALELVLPEAARPTNDSMDAAGEASSEPLLEVADEADEEAESSGWQCAGSSAAKRWSVSFDKAVEVQASEEPLKPLTPTETSSIDFNLGAMIVANGRVYYAHGDSLRGFWPGKGDTSIALSGEVGCESWRLASFKGRVFCVAQDWVEIVGLGTSAAQSKFAGKYIDQVCTDSHWVGLLAQDGDLLIDFRDEGGKQLGKPRPLPAKSDEARAMAAQGETVYVGTAKGKLLRVTAGEMSEAKLDGEIIWLAAQRTGLLALLQRKKGLCLVQAGADGAIQSQLDLDFNATLDHPVIMGDRLYLVNADTAEIVSYSLKKLAPAETMALPGNRVVTFTGVYKDNRHALLVTVQEGEGHSGSVVLIDPKSGDTMMVCRVNHPHVDVIAANGKIVVATGCSYQNMVRVFDPCAAASKSKKAA